MRNHITAAWLIALTGAAEAQIYEWIDAEGNRHYSDQEPVGVTFRIVGDDESQLSTYTPDPLPARRAEAASDAAAGAPGSRPAAAAVNPDDVCPDYLKRLESVQRQLRAGYSEPRGNRLRAQRRALQDAYRRDCS